MAVLRIVWLPAVLAAVGTLSVTGLSAFALSRQFGGSGDDSLLSWVLLPFVSKFLFLVCMSIAAFWVGARSVKYNFSRMRAALVGGSIPLVVVATFLLLSLLTTGQSELDELAEGEAMVNLGVSLMITMALGVTGVIVYGRRSVA